MKHYISIVSHIPILSFLPSDDFMLHPKIFPSDPRNPPPPTESLNSQSLSIDSNCFFSSSVSANFLGPSMSEVYVMSFQFFSIIHAKLCDFMARKFTDPEDHHKKKYKDSVQLQ